MQCSECECGGKFKQAWVNGGRSHDSLKVASALTVKVMEIPRSVAPSEIWLRDYLENIYALLFWFLGFGFQLAMSNVGWLVTHKFVIVVPDPIGLSPSWSLRGGTRVSSGLNARQMEELEESFAAGPALQLSFFQDTSDWPPFLLLCRAADEAV